MTQLSIRLIGADKLQVGFNKYAQSVRTITREDAREAMRRAKKASVSDPPGGAYSVPERGYIRTMNLSASTYLEEDGLSFRIQSNAVSKRGQPYSKYVIGDADGYGQASVHTGYWTPLRQSVDTEVERLQKDLDEHLQDSAEALGL
jgi:hypothetical protein